MTRSKKAILDVFATALALTLGAGLAACGGKDETPTYGYGEEGSYYYDASDGTEYLLTLRQGTYVLTFGTTGTSGTYEWSEGTLTFFSDGEETAEGYTEGDVLFFTYGGRTYTCLRHVYYAVTFVYSDTTLTTQSVLNGKAATDPGEIALEGYVFYGWYQDAAFSSAFDFSAGITADATVYGRYLPEGGEKEYAVTYDYTGETAETRGGVVYDLPEPERAGYTFLGWWVSATNSADELTYRYEGEQLFEDTTLFAVWAEEGGSCIGASVYSDGITWLNSAGSTTEVTIYDGYGTFMETRTAQSSSGSLAYAFGSLTAGKYLVEVTSGGVTETLTYVAKGLHRVSGLDVLPGSLFKYDAVEGAERYYILIDCANPAHDHGYYDNGTSLYYDFSDCVMGADGITFTVVTWASGRYFSSSSYNYFLGLDKAAVTAADDTVSWGRVSYAMEYEVYVDGVLAATVSGTEYSLKRYGAGTYEIEVRPVTTGYWSEKSEAVSYVKTTLASPEITGMDGLSVTWTAVEGAAGYVVSIGGVETYVDAAYTTLYLTDETFVPGLDSYEIAVKATATDSDNDSPYGDAVTVTGADVGSAVSYENGTVTWQYSMSASEYRITVNDGDETVVRGANSAPVTLTKAGDNEIRIDFVDGDGTVYGTARVTVYAYAIVFDARGGTAILDGEPVDAIYVAKGDAVTLPTAQYSGILADFIGWYTLPDTANTPESDSYRGDGYLYEDGTVFTGSSTLVLYAAWINQRIRITLNPGDGYLVDGDGAAIEYVEIPVNSTSFTIAVPEIDDKAYVFYGWYSGAGGTGYRYTFEDGSASSYFRDDSVTALYAYWIKVLDFSATEYANYGTVASVTKGADIALVSEVTVPDVYTVDGVELTVRYVEGTAFQSLSTLEVLNIPDTILYMNVTSNGYVSGSGVFASSANVREVNVYATGDEPSTTKEVVFYSDDGVLFRYDDETGRMELYYYPYGRVQETYEIPATVSNETEYAYDGTGLNTVPVVRDVTYLGDNTFRGHTELLYMTIPDTVTDLGTYTFYQCSSLSTVTLGSGIETIGGYCFYQCTALASVDLPDTLKSIGTYAFYGCTALSSAAFGSGLETIESYAFRGCSALRTVELQYGLTEIGSYAFYQCTSLAGLSLPYSLETIGNYAFYGCTALRSALVPDSVTSLGTYVFYGCTDLREAHLSESLVSVPNYTFYNCYALETVNIPEGATEIGSSAFYNCYCLTTVTIPAGVTSIGSNAFYNCHKLVEVYNMSSSLTLTVGNSGNGYVAYYAKNVYTPYEGESHITDIDGMEFIYDADGSWFFFAYTGTGTELTLPESVEGNAYEILNYAAYGKDGIVTLTIPSSVTAIGNYAFYNCCALEHVYFGANVADFSSSNYVFYQAGQSGSGMEVVIGSEVERIPSYLFFPYNSATYAPRITTVTFEEGSVCSEIGGYAFSYCSTLSAITLPGSLTYVGDYAFRGCSSLTDIVIQDGVTYLGSYAFYQCTSLKTVQLSASLTAIANYTFYQDTSLAGIVIPEGVTEIGTYAFYGATGLKYVSLPSTLETIGNYAFYNCMNLIQIVLPESLVSIGTQAFNNCYKLVEIYNASSLEIAVGDGSANGYVANYAINVYTPESGNSHLIYLEGYWFVYGADDDYYVIQYDGDASVLELAEDIYGNPYTIYQYAFYQNTDITTVIIPESITSIGSHAFDGCTEVDEIYYYAAEADDLASSNYAFAYVGQGTEGVTLYIGATVKEIPDYLFYPYSTASYAPNITSIVFEEGSVCESIGEYAFRGLTSLTSIVLPSSVRSIGAYAFYGCTSLSSVTFSDGLESIGDYAFYNCSAVSTLTLPEGLESIGAYAFYGCSSVRRLTVPASCKTLGNYAFRGCTSISTLTLLRGLERIGDYCFYGCSSFKSVTVPATVTYIGEYAFNGCSSLVNISILGTEALIGSYVFAGTAFYEDQANWSNGVLYIDRYLIVVDTDTVSGRYTITDGTVGIAGRAFYNCRNLTGITIPSSVRTLGDYMFYNCSALTEVNLPEGLTQIGSYCFYGCTALTSIDIPDTVVSIGSYCFRDCTALRRVDLSRSITELSGYLFYGCSALVSIDIPAGVTSIGTYAFYKCESLSEITIPDGVTEIGTYAFACCTGITEMTLPDAVKEIPADLFYDCYALVSVSFAPDITAIGGSAFYECESLKVAYIPETVESIGASAFYGCVGLEEVRYDAASVPDYSSTSTPFGRIGRDAEGLVVYIGANVTRIPAYLFNASASPYTVKVVFAEGSVCSCIGDRAFYQNYYIEEINVPSTVTYIGDRAFYSCESLRSVGDISGATYVGQYCFSGCVKLNGIVLCDSMTSIEQYAFEECEALSSVNIPAACKSIGVRAFSGCTSLMTVTLPAGLEEIGNYAFRNCTKLVEVCNLSSLDIVAGSSDFGGVAQYALHVYGAGEESVIEEIDGFLFIADDDGAYSLLGYAGSETDITLPEYVLGKTYAIYDYAFSGTSIVTVAIPETVTEMGEGAFYGCDRLVRAVLPDTMTCIPDYCFYGCTSLTNIAMEGAVEIGEYAFSGCTSLTRLVLPDSLTTLGYCSFYGCSSLESVNIPANVTSVDRAFNECTGLREIRYDAVELADFSSNNFVFADAGQGSDGITVYVGAAVTRLPDYLFRPSNGSGYEPKIAAVIFEEGSACTYIGDYCFYGVSALREINIPSGVTYMGDYSFYNCRSLVTVTLPEGVTSVGTQAFYGCYKLVEVYNMSPLSLSMGSNGNGYVAYYAKNVYTPEEGESHLFEVDGFTFVYDASGNYYMVSDSGTESFIVTPDTDFSYEIYQYSFYERTDITGVVISDSANGIGTYAFYDCSSLEYVDTGNGVGAIGSYAFYECEAIRSLTIGEGVTSIGNYAFYYTRYIEEIHYNAVSASNLSSSNRVFYYTGRYADDLTVYIGAKVERIPSYLFFPYSGTNYAPYITTVVFEEGSVCSEIGQYAFAYISKLTKVELPGSLVTIGQYAFYNCSISNMVVIGDSVGEIGAYAFASNSYVDLVLGASVTTIGNYCFNTSTLTNVYYRGGAADWDAMSIGSNNTYLTGAIRYYYSEEEPDFSYAYNYWHYVDGEIVVWKKD